MKYFEMILGNIHTQPFYIQAQTVEEAKEIIDNSKHVEYSLMMDFPSEIRNAPFSIKETDKSSFEKLNIKDNDVIKYVQNEISEKE